MSRRILGIALSLCFFLIAGAAGAETLRCGNHLISVGDLRLKVRNYCGEPDDVGETFISQTRTYRTRHRISYEEEETIATRVELWTYNFGTNRFMQRLHFVADRLTAIETLGYGFERGNK